METRRKQSRSFSFCFEPVSVHLFWLVFDVCLSPRSHIRQTCTYLILVKIVADFAYYADTLTIIIRALLTVV